MRRLLSVVTLAGALVLTAACGVTANTTAATVSGRDVPIEDVTALVEDEAAMEVLFGVTAGTGEGDQSTQAGDTARQALLFEIERVAWIEELERWGLEPTERDREAAAQQLDAELGAATAQRPLTDRTRELLVEYLTARNLLSQRLAQIDPSDEADLRRLHEGSSWYWDRVCLAAVRFTPDLIAEARAAVEDGAGVEQLPEQVEGAELVADPEQRCIARSQLPGELRDAVDETRVGRTSRVVLVDDGAGGRTGFLFRVDERQRVGFEDAREELEGIVGTLAQQGAASWVQLQVAEADINPRYGQGVGAGGAAGLAIVAPPAPSLSLSQLITQAREAADAAQTLTAETVPGT